MIVDSYMWFSKLTDTYAKTTSNDSKDIYFFDVITKIELQK